MEKATYLAGFSLTHRKYYGLSVLRNTPTYLQCDLTFGLDDYGKKERIKHDDSRREFLLSLTRVEALLFSSN
jgi:hypothetical protein